MRVKKSRRVFRSSQAKLVQNILSELKAGFQLTYGQQLRGVCLFGSYARGEADQKSDCDILVVLSDFQRYAQEVDRTSQLAADLSLKYGSLSVWYSCANANGCSSFLSNVRDEAVPA